MKVVFTGGGTGGHFYPLIAIAEALNDIALEKHLLAPKLYYLAPVQFDEKALFANSIEYVYVPAGKLRRYTSFENVTDMFVTLYGIGVALSKLFNIYPDVVMSKGGYASVPIVIAAKILRIPIIIHESDAKPGRANLLAAKFATKIAISFESAASFFPANVQKKIARTGIPIRKALLRVETQGAAQYLNLDPEAPTILFLGGSQGAARINETILSILPDLVSFANVIHQTGTANFTTVSGVAKVVLEKSEHAERYHPVDYLSDISLQRVAAVATLVISRAGANSITEISLWKKPSIIIPIPESISHDQRSNAYGYAHTGAAIVIEEENLTPHLLRSEIHRILDDKETCDKMAAASVGFADPDAAKILANEILSIGISHES